MHRSCFSKIEKQRLCEDQLDIWDRGKRANNTRMPIICQMNAMPVGTSLLHAYRYVKIRGKFVYGFATTGIVSPYDGTVAENKIEENFWSKPLSYTCIFSPSRFLPATFRQIHQNRREIRIWHRRDGACFALWRHSRGKQKGNSWSKPRKSQGQEKSSESL